MNSQQSFTRYALPILNLLAFLFTLFVNYLSYALPLNGKDTGAVSEQYPNLFVPAGLTFSIWSLIYLGLLAFSLWQLAAPADRVGNAPASVAVRALGGLFIASCLLNSAWLFAWHYDLIGLSVVLMLLLLSTLIAITRRVFGWLPNLQPYRWLLRAPFGLYLGWISIATIANITAWLVHLRWDGFGLSPVSWTIVVILIGLIITLGAVRTYNNVFYGLAVAWAFLGIVLKRSQEVEPSSLILLTAGISALIVLAVSLSRLRYFLQPTSGSGPYVRQVAEYRYDS